MKDWPGCSIRDKQELNTENKEAGTFPCLFFSPFGQIQGSSILPENKWMGDGKQV